MNHELIKDELKSLDITEIDVRFFVNAHYGPYDGVVYFESVILGPQHNIVFKQFI